MKCFHAAVNVHAITDAAILPSLIKRSLQRVWSAPAAAGVLLDIFETVRRGHFWQNERR
jgi:hypothetical protein